MPTMSQTRLPLLARQTRTAGQPRRVLFSLVAIALIVSAMGAALLPAPHPAAAASATTTDYLNLRSEPSTSSDVIDVMPVGAAVEITGDQDNGFYPVNYNGEDGWAFGAYIDSSGGGWNTVTATTGVNLRSDPSFDADVLDVIPEGGVATLIGDGANGFISVSYNGTYGWVDMDYLSWGGDSAAPVDNGDSGETSQPPADTSSEQPSDTAPADDTSAPPADQSASGDDIVSIIYAAADRYGQSREDMLRVATCESNLDPSAVNPSSGASGLFQFMPSTWASTPYADDDIFDAWASANAAGWMWSVGRRNEWECQ